MRTGPWTMTVVMLALGAGAAEAQTYRVPPVGLRSELAAARLGVAKARTALRGAMPSLRALRGSMRSLRTSAFERDVMRSLGYAGVRSLRGTRESVNIPEPWIQVDPADSLYRSARQELTRGRYQRAARIFGELRERHRDSGYVPDSYYFEALALYRAGGETRYGRALELLEAQAERHPDAASRSDANQLRVRIQSALARGGDVESAAGIQQLATRSCDEEDQGLRAAALSALLNMDSDRAVPILREILRDRNECSAELRRRAVFLVSQKMGDETVDILMDLAHRNPDPDREVREQAVFWLSQVESEEALDALEAILADGDEELQETALFGISQHRSDRATRILRDFAERPGAPLELRSTAIFWIGQSGNAGGAAYLRELFGRLEDNELREQAIMGIAQSGGAAERAWLVERALDAAEDPDVRRQALFWASQNGGLTVEQLVDLYRSVEALEMKEQAIYALAQAEAAEAVDALMGIAESEDDPELREHAVFWLGQIDDPRVDAFLIRLIRGGGQ